MVILYLDPWGIWCCSVLRPCKSFSINGNNSFGPEGGYYVGTLGPKNAEKQTPRDQSFGLGSMMLKIHRWWSTWN